MSRLLRPYLLFCLVLVLAGLAAPAPAATRDRALEAMGEGPPATNPDKRVALVIGNSAYEHASALGNPRNDARDMTVALMELGFDVVEGYDLDVDGMQGTLRTFAKKVQGAGVALFFYAGHGVQVDGRNYMVPVDAQLDSKEDLEFEAVNMGRVLVQLEREIRTNIIILDACRNNPLADNLARALRGSSRSVEGSGGGLAALDAVAPGTLISFSTQPGATASDGNGRNSPYTKALLEYIRSPGLEVQAMMRRVGAKVVSGSDGQQVPWQNASLTTDFYFTKPPKDAEKAIIAQSGSRNRAEIELWLDVKDSGSVEELSAYLRKYPRGTFADVAQARIKGLELQAEVPSGADAVQALYSRLAKRGIIVDEPQQAHEFYSNARLYDLRSDSLNASKMYARYIEFGLPYIDPHLEYQTHLKAQEGRAGAREAYNELAYDHPDDPMMQYAAAMLQSRERRVQQLEAFVGEHPQFGPAFYDLSLDYSVRRLGTQTLDDKRKERDYLDKFFAAVERGEVYKFFLDKKIAEKRIEEASERQAQVKGLYEKLLDQPMMFNASRSNAGWMVTASPMEAGYTDVQFAMPGKEFKSLGTYPMIDPITGKPRPKVTAELPFDAGTMTLRFRYVDARGQMQGPFEFQFDPNDQLRAQARMTVDMTKTSWAWLRDWDGKVLVYFTSLLSNRCALREIHYGIERSTPDREFEFPPCDPNQPHTVPDGITVDAPAGTNYVSVQVTYFDGTKSEVVQVRKQP